MKEITFNKVIMNKGVPMYDAIVIGAGINGSSAALHLARKGRNTALVEQFPALHARGSSAGQSRICRRCHFSFDSFDAIIDDSINQWASLEKESGVSLLRPHKLYYISKKNNTKGIDQVKTSIIKSDSTPLIRSIQDFNKEFSTTFSDDKIVIEDLDGGILMAEKCIRTIQTLFMESGGKIIDEFPVGKISVAEDGTVLLNGSSGVLQTKSLVICAGPWTSKLLQPLGVDLPLRVVKIGVFYWPLLEERKTFTFLGHEGKGEIYGLPSIEYPGMVKICFHDGDYCDPDRRDLGGNNFLKDKVSRYIDENFPWVGGQPVIEESCMYTMTPDREMIIDTHPKYKNIVFGCGFSGTGFKTGPTVGKILSEMVAGGNQTFDVRDFSMNRFLNGSSKL